MNIYKVVVNKQQIFIKAKDALKAYRKAFFIFKSKYGTARVTDVVFYKKIIPKPKKEKKQLDLFKKRGRNGKGKNN